MDEQKQVSDKTFEIKSQVTQYTGDDKVSVRQFLGLHVKDEALERYDAFKEAEAKENKELSVGLFKGERNDMSIVYLFAIKLEGIEDLLYFQVDEYNMKITFKKKDGLIQ